jgi:PAS domain S-box-containing protein
VSLTDAQIQFAAEFVTLMVAVSALALTILRPLSSLWRLAAVVGLLAVAAPAFLHGSLLAGGGSALWLGFARAAGAVVSFAVLPRWWAELRSGWFLRAGLLVWVAAGAVEMVSAQALVLDLLLLVGGVLIAFALLALSRRAIAMRVAASGAATLLVVVLVLALALAAAISSSVERAELNRLTDRATIEGAQIQTAGTDAVTAATFGGADLQAYFRQSASNPLTTVGSGSSVQAKAAVAQITSRLADLYALDRLGSFAYVDRFGNPLSVTGSISAELARAVAAQPALNPEGCKVGHGLFVLSGSAWEAASYPECASNLQVLGVVVSIVPLGNAYLTSRVAVDPSVPLKLALVSGRSVIAAAGERPSPAEVSLVADVSRAGSRVTTKALGGSFVSVVPLTVATRPAQLSMVLSAPTTTVLSNRTHLYRTLFLIAFGGTILALGLAIFTGDRITFGIRRLTRAAARIQRGDVGVRASIQGRDEVAVLGSAFDSMLDSVADQASALQAAADDEARLRNRMEAVIAGMTDALVAVDAAGLITDFNRAAEQMTGVTTAAAVGRPADSVVRVDDADGDAFPTNLVDPDRSSWARLGQLRQPDGGLIPVAVAAGALRGPGEEMVGTVLVFRDLRREHEVEQMKTEFLSRVGHELRTPLTGIMGYAEILLRRDVPPERTRSWHDEILQSARRLLRIVEMLEFFASSGAGRMTFRREPVDIGALVNGVTSSWSSRLPGNVSIGRKVERGTPTLMGDRRWLTMAVDELIDNAAKFSPDGGPILVSVERVGPSSGNGTSGSGESIALSVKDRGKGMSADELAVAFSDFAQADNSDTRRFGGLGLGLAVVRRVVEGHGGEVKCRSAVGSGSTFTIVLPVTERPAEEAAAERRTFRRQQRRSPTAPSAPS